jgi:hypothetical protein
MGERPPTRWSVVKIWLKIIVTVVAGSVTYLLTKSTDQPEIWQLTMSIFVGGIVLVVQVLVETAEQVRGSAERGAVELKRGADLVESLSAANTLLANAEKNLGGDSVERLVQAAAGLDRTRTAQVRFADHEIGRLTDLLEGLTAGRAEYEGADRDWLLGLTETATSSIDATSMTSFSGSRGFVDEGQYWSSEPGRRYLDRQQDAIARGVRVRRVFLVSAKENPTDEQIRALLGPHRAIRVETRILRSDRLDRRFEGTLTDFVLFDQQISYDLHSAYSLDEDTPPLVAMVALVVGERRLADRRQLFQSLWNAASEWSDPQEDGPAAEHTLTRTD